MANFWLCFKIDIRGIDSMDESGQSFNFYDCEMLGASNYTRVILTMTSSPTKVKFMGDEDVHLYGL